MLTTPETQSELRAILNSGQNRPRSVFLKLRSMNQQAGDPGEASPASTFNSARERDSRYSLGRVEWFADNFTREWGRKATL